MNFPFDLVIFDFDGVLVDSEILACKAWSDLLIKNGIPVSLQDMVEKYTGQTTDRIRQKIETDYHCSLPDGFVEYVNPFVEDLFAKELKAINGAHDFIRALPCPSCIASGSTLESISKCLKYTGLDAFFSENVYSAWNVEHGKPAPDIFLYAAEKSGADAKKCLVIEDSFAGVTAGVAAGMCVFGFSGGSHCLKNHADMLKKAGARAVYGSFNEMSKALYPSS